MGAGPTKYQLAVLPGKPGKFKEGSKIALWYISKNPSVPYTADKGVVTKVQSSKTYNVKVDNSSVEQFNIPYYLLSYPNEERRWSDFFVEGQRVLFKEKRPCLIINIDSTDDGDSKLLALRDIATGRVHMNVKPEEISFDHKYFA